LNLCLAFPVLRAAVASVLILPDIERFGDDHRPLRGGQPPLPMRSALLGQRGRERLPSFSPASTRMKMPLSSCSAMFPEAEIRGFRVPPANSSPDEGCALYGAPSSGLRVTFIRALRLVCDLRRECEAAAHRAAAAFFFSSSTVLAAFT
jgi:hypothetical protein